MKQTQLNHQSHTETTTKYPLCFLINNVELSGNVGSFFRIADALGIEKIYLCGNTIVPPNSKLNKAARTTERYVPYEYEKDALSVLKKLKVMGYRIISLEITSISTDISDLRISEHEKVCLILGAEIEGINQKLLDVSDEVVHIPMKGKNSSMNVAMACSIAGYEITRQLS